MVIRSVVWGRRAFLLAVLVTGLLAGMVGMHHLSVALDVPATVAAPMSDPAMGSDPAHQSEEHGTGLLHLCLAVLTAVALLLMSAVLWGRPDTAPVVGRGGTSNPRTAPRAPPPGAPARLALLCVLRT